MLINNLSLCPGNENIPTEEFITMMQFEDKKYQLHKCFNYGLNQLQRLLYTTLQFTNATTDDKIGDDLKNYLSSYNGCFSATESIKSIFMTILESIIEFFKNLIKKISDFFGFIFKRGEANLNNSQKNMYAINRAIKQDYNNVNNLLNIAITPSIPFSVYEKIMTTTIRVQDKFNNITAHLKDASDRLDKHIDGYTKELNGERGNTAFIHSSNRLVLNNTFITDELIKESASIGLILHDREIQINEESFTTFDVEFNSYFKNRLSENANPRSFADLGYTIDALNRIVTNHASRLFTLRERADDMINILKKYLNKIEDIKILVDKTKDTDVSKLSRNPSTHYRYYLMDANSISTIVNIQSKISIVVEELLSYSNFLTSSAAKILTQPNKGV